MKIEDLLSKNWTAVSLSSSKALLKSYFSIKVNWKSLTLELLVEDLLVDQSSEHEQLLSVFPRWILNEISEDVLSTFKVL